MRDQADTPQLEPEVPVTQAVVGAVADAVVQEEVTEEDLVVASCAVGVESRLGQLVANSVNLSAGFRQSHFIELLEHGSRELGTRFLPTGSDSRDVYTLRLRETVTCKDCGCTEQEDTSHTVLCVGLGFLSWVPTVAFGALLEKQFEQKDIASGCGCGGARGRQSWQTLSVPPAVFVQFKRLFHTGSGEVSKDEREVRLLPEMQMSLFLPGTCSGGIAPVLIVLLVPLGRRMLLMQLELLVLLVLLVLLELDL